MTELRWVRVTEQGNIPPREGRPVLIAGRELALFNLGPSPEIGAGDRFLATGNRCPHQGGPLCDGIVTATSVVCPLHAWKVNLETGAVERPAAGREHCVETFPTRVEDGIILIGLPLPGRRSLGEGDRPFDGAQGGPFDSAQGGPFDGAQGRREHAA
jgi:nitrite reductase (NADH) small subunit